MWHTRGWWWSASTRPRCRAPSAPVGARFLFLSDAERRWLPRLGLLEETDALHEPYRPTAFTLHPDLTIHRRYDGNWYWGRPTMEDLRQDMRAI